jgi:hypothetical protein
MFKHINIPLGQTHKQRERKKDRLMTVHPLLPSEGEGKTIEYLTPSGPK